MSLYTAYVNIDRILLAENISLNTLRLVYMTMFLDLIKKKSSQKKHKNYRVIFNLKRVICANVPPIGAWIRVKWNLDVAILNYAFNSSRWWREQIPFAWFLFASYRHSGVVIVAISRFFLSLLGDARERSNRDLCGLESSKIVRISNEIIQKVSIEGHM